MKIIAFKQSKAVKSKLGSYFLPKSQYVDTGLPLTFLCEVSEVEFRIKVGSYIV